MVVVTIVEVSESDVVNQIAPLDRELVLISVYPGCFVLYTGETNSLPLRSRVEDTFSCRQQSEGLAVIVITQTLNIV